MLQKQINLYDVPLEFLSDRIKNTFPYHEYDYKKHLILIENNERETIAYIRLPLHFSVDKTLTITSTSAVILYLSVESGNAAICIMRANENIYHTTFSAYMSRKKQGYSQIKYLNKKGKSRAGSRVRLASTVEFFEKINSTLTDLFEKHEISRIAIDCSASLVPYLHQSKVACPFDKRDDRIYKIPLHIQQCNYTNLDAAIKKLMAPILFYNEVHEALIERFGFTSS